MKTVKRFNGRWYLAALVGAVIVAETISWLLSRHFDVRFNPFLAAMLGVGAATAVVAWYYEDADIG